MVWTRSSPNSDRPLSGMLDGVSGLEGKVPWGLVALLPPKCTSCVPSSVHEDPRSNLTVQPSGSTGCGLVIQRKLGGCLRDVTHSTGEGRHSVCPCDSFRRSWKQAGLSRGFWLCAAWPPSGELAVATLSVVTRGGLQAPPGDRPWKCAFLFVCFSSLKLPWR